MSAPPAVASPPGHVVYCDWLKFLVIYGIVVFHTALPFSYSSWLIESGRRDRRPSLPTRFLFGLRPLRSSPRPVDAARAAQGGG
jgi:hypothetical protein